MVLFIYRGLMRGSGSWLLALLHWSLGLVLAQCGICDEGGTGTSFSVDTSFFPSISVVPIPLDIHIYKHSLPTKYLFLPCQSCFLPTFLVLCYIFLTSCFHLGVSLSLVCFPFIFLSCCFLGILSAYLRTYMFHKLCVYHPGVFPKLNKISQFQSNTPFCFYQSTLIYYTGDMFRLSISHHQVLLSL